MNIKVRSRVTNNGTLYLKGCYADELFIFASEDYIIEYDNQEKTILIFPAGGNGRKLTKHNKSYLIHIPVKYDDFYNRDVIITYDYDEKMVLIYSIKIEVALNERNRN